jgi:tetratricopeptide (TPR) repeat protein
MKLRAPALILWLCALALVACDRPSRDAPGGPRKQTVGQAQGQQAPAPNEETRQAPESAPDQAAQAPKEAPGQAEANPRAALERELDRLTALQEPTEEQRKLLGLGKLALDQGNTSQAVAIFEQLQDTGPMSGLKLSAAIALADLYSQRGEHKRAIELLERVHRRAPPTPELVFVLARCYKADGQLPQAIEVYREALRLQPLFLRAHVEIGGMLHELGKQEESGQAFLDYERAIYQYSALMEAADTHPSDKIKIAEAFSLLPDDRAAQALVGALDDPDLEVRVAVAQALGEIGSHGALEPLEEARRAVKDDPAWAKALDKAIAQIKASPKAQGAQVGPAFEDGPPQ